MIEKIEFKAKGHHNILGRHRNTIEFTKDRELTLRGDCIIAVDGDFSSIELKKALSWEHAKVTMICKGKEESFTGKINPGFNSSHEMVFRITDYASERTFLTRCDKAAKDLSRAFIDVLKDDNTEIGITIWNIF